MFTARRLSVVLALLAAASVLVPAALAARPGGKLVPASGALFGARVNLSYGNPNRNPMAEIEQFEAQIGRRLDIDHHYYQWTTPFPTPIVQWDLDNGRIPLISWAGDRSFPDLNAVVAGDYDAMIRTRAQAIKALGAPVFLRFGWEMNGAWSGFGGLADRTQWPVLYVAAWRHIHDIFVAEGATNAVWVWCPAERSSKVGAWNHFTNYYPGDEYVDWVGIDGYNWGVPRRSFSFIFTPVYRAYAHKKPIMIGETGSVEAGGSKAQWINEAREALKADFPSIAAFVYFNSNPGVNMLVDSSTESLEAFRGMASDPYFNPGADAIAPTTASIHPALGETRVRVRSAVGFTTAVELDCASVSPATVAIVPAVPNSPLCAGNAVVLGNARLAPLTTYRVTVQGVRDASGQELGTTVWSFTTDRRRPLVRLLSRVVVRPRGRRTTVVRTHVSIARTGDLVVGLLNRRGKRRSLSPGDSRVSTTVVASTARRLRIALAGPSVVELRLRIRGRIISGRRYRLAFAAHGPAPRTYYLRFRAP